MFLSDADLHELTGYVKPSAQRKWLEKKHWPFEVSALGRPRVLRAFAEKKLGLETAVKNDHTEPDFSAWGGKAA